jgi:hypothetical protein
MTEFATYAERVHDQRVKNQALFQNSHSVAASFLFEVSLVYSFSFLSEHSSFSLDSGKPNLTTK